MGKKGKKERKKKKRRYIQSKILIIIISSSPLSIVPYSPSLSVCTPSPSLLWFLPVILQRHIREPSEQVTLILRRWL